MALMGIISFFSATEGSNVGAYPKPSALSFWKRTRVICRTVNAQSLYLVGRRQLLPGIGSKHGSWFRFRFEPWKASDWVLYWGEAVA